MCVHLLLEVALDLLLALPASDCPLPLAQFLGRGRDLDLCRAALHCQALAPELLAALCHLVAQGHVFDVAGLPASPAAAVQAAVLEGLRKRHWQVAPMLLELPTGPELLGPAEDLLRCGVGHTHSLGRWVWVAVEVLRPLLGHPPRPGALAAPHAAARRMAALREACPRGRQVATRWGGA